MKQSYATKEGKMSVANLSKPKRLGILVTLTVAIAISGALAACGPGEPTPSQEPPAQLRLQFSWVHVADHAGFYMAEAGGYYATENLDVDLLAGGYDAAGEFIDPIVRVMAGEAEFGLADAGTLLVARAEGKPLVAVVNLYQRSPVAFVSLAEKGIVRPQDLAGSTVHLDLYTSGIVYQALLTATGVDRAQIDEVQRTDFTLTPLLQGEADVIDGWVTNEVVELKLQDQGFNMILPSDYGVVMYPDVIFATEQFVENNPDLVERFVRATVQGMQAVIDAPEKAAKVTVTYDPDNLALDATHQAVLESLPLLNPAGSRPGMMSAEEWQATHQMLLDQGILAQPLDVSAAYDLTFLNKAYAE
jgi:NitT/TauT family transport system substrate-binding protein